jgi:hypothetical protein
MDNYTGFINKYAAYEDKYMEKRALLETLLPMAAQHIPSLAGHLPPDGIVGLAGLASKYMLLRGAGKGISALKDAHTLSKRFGGGIREGLRLRGTPRANMVLGKHTSPNKALAVIGKVDKASDAASMVYNGAMLAKHLV